MPDFFSGRFRGGLSRIVSRLAAKVKIANLPNCEDMVAHLEIKIGLFFAFSFETDRSLPIFNTHNESN
ncbi:protein of unknown function [Aminobacter niigataensis]|nr:protein of unknown function [Aminobacter niigataensis]